MHHVAQSDAAVGGTGPGRGVPGSNVARLGTVTEPSQGGENQDDEAQPELARLLALAYFFQNTLRWRNLQKITIAEVHGGVYAAGLMLARACDLIVSADDTLFADPVGPRLGSAGQPGDPMNPQHLRRLETLGIPVVVALSGTALGAGSGFHVGQAAGEPGQIGTVLRRKDGTTRVVR